MTWFSHSCSDLKYSYSQEIFAIDMLTVLKPSLEHDDCKHVLRLSWVYLDGDQTSISCHLDISVESIGRFICC